MIDSGAVSEVRRARLVTDGQQHIVVILDEELVARFPRDNHAIESLRGEARLLTHLAGRVSVPLPVPVHADESFTLHRMLHGVVTSRRAPVRGTCFPSHIGDRCSPRWPDARPRGWGQRFQLERRCMLAYMQRTTVKLPDELDARLRYEAQRRGSTVSALTREAIENLLGAHHGKRRLLAAGAGASGRDDISERIEEILADEVQPSH